LSSPITYQRFNFIGNRMAKLRPPTHMGNLATNLNVL